jgi:hypothetical protein
MKKQILFFMFFFVSFNPAWAMSPCQRLLMDVELRCQRDLASKDEFLQHCLRRRDTCSTIGAKDSPDRCQEINTCMQTHQTVFAQNHQDVHACRYTWNEKGDRCLVSRSLFSLVSQCPGRITVTVTMIDGFSGGLDQNFDCSSQAFVLNQAMQRCDEIKDQYIQQCPEVALAGLADVPSYEPRYLENHHQQIWGITPESLLRTNDDGRYSFYPERTDPTPSNQPTPSAQER